MAKTTLRPRARTSSAFAFVSASTLSAAACVILAAFAAPGAEAQSIHGEQPLHVTVGSPQATLPLLPTERLRAAWTTRIGQSMENAPVLLPNGQLFITSASGEAQVLGDDGKPLTKFSTGARTSSAATRLSDGTVLLVTATGEAIGIRAGQTRFRTRIFSEVHGAPSAFAMADGGAILSSGADLVAIDGSGVARAHVSLPESPSEPLFAVGDAIGVVGTSGSVHLWVPGSELESVGTFGERTDGVVAVGRTLTAIAGGRLLDLDTVQKFERPRAEPVRGGFVGQPVRIDHDVAALFRDGTHVELVQLASDGSERRRVALAAVSGLVVDGGAGGTASAGANGGASGAGGRSVRSNGGGTGSGTSSGATGLGGAIEISNIGFAAVADVDGTVAFAIPLGPVGVVGRDGSVVTTSNPCVGGVGSVNTTGGLAKNIATTLLPADRASGPSSGASSAALVVSCSTGFLQELVSSQK